MGKSLKQRGKRQAKPLTAMKERFAREYVIDLKPMEAAIRAGYSAKTAAAKAGALLTEPAVRELIDQLKTARAEKLEVSSEDVLRELVRISSSDIRQVFAEDGSLKPMADWPEAIARCVASVEVDEIFEWVEDDNGNKEKVLVGHTKKVKFWDKNKSLDMLGRHLKLFNGDTKGDGPTVILVDNTGGDMLKGIR